MKAYNIYYNGRKINNIPLNSDELKKVFEKTYIYKKNIITGNIDEIPVSNIQTRKCIVV